MKIFKFNDFFPSSWTFLKVREIFFWFFFLNVNVYMGQPTSAGAWAPQAQNASSRFQDDQSPKPDKGKVIWVCLVWAQTSPTKILARPMQGYDQNFG
jgi:hypothetical protein